MGLLGSSITLGVSRCFPRVKTVGYAHRAVTRRKARRLAVATEIVGDLKKSVAEADVVILATPISSFEHVFSEIRGALRRGCVVTDVGSTKVLPHRWAARLLGSEIDYVGSHPIAGSEQRGVEYGRDDLFEGALCILTTAASSARRAVRVLKQFWSALGCEVRLMKPAEHDRVFGTVSHLPHVTAAALINAIDAPALKYAGRGFLDTSRIASGPAGIWVDVVLANAGNVSRGIDKIVDELLKMKKAVNAGRAEHVGALLESARRKREAVMKQKYRKKEAIS
jgi:prephenate dehydrogenase